MFFSLLVYQLIVSFESSLSEKQPSTFLLLLTFKNPTVETGSLAFVETFTKSESYYLYQCSGPAYHVFV